MWTKESVGEIVLEVLEQTFNDFISLPKDEKYRNKQRYKKALDRYEKAVANANFYLKHLEEW
jgi:hypothetical protein